MQIVMPTKPYEIEEADWPAYVLLTVTPEFAQMLLKRMDFILKAQQDDADLLRVTYNVCDKVEFFDDHKDVTADLDFGASALELKSYVVVADSFELPQEGVRYCDAVTLVIDEEYVWVKASERHTDFYFTTGGISRSDIEQWVAVMTYTT